MLYYCPLECYQERYTYQWSAPGRAGWLERRWIDNDIPYVRIDPSEGKVQQLKTGQVLDATGRSRHCFRQIEMLLELAEKGELDWDDTIYFDDFWHPGIEAIPYAFQQMGKQRPQMYAYLFAQSVDQFDFTYPMRNWIRHFEKGIGSILDGIFVTCPFLQELVVLGGIAPEHKVYPVGHPFCSEEVLERMPLAYQAMLQMGLNTSNISPKRENKVVFSSRWDLEKNPMFFLDVVQAVLAREGFQDTAFTICTGSPELRSNSSHLLRALEAARTNTPQLKVLTGCTKEIYYQELVSAKIQFNCALQDFVPLTLLEASVAGCWPVYPYFRAMPETFGGDTRFMYESLDVHSAANLICKVLRFDETAWYASHIKQRAWIHERFDSSWARMLAAMDDYYECDEDESEFPLGGFKLRDLIDDLEDARD